MRLWIRDDEAPIDPALTKILCVSSNSLVGGFQNGVKRERTKGIVLDLMNAVFNRGLSLYGIFG